MAQLSKTCGSESRIGPDSNLRFAIGPLPGDSGIRFRNPVPGSDSTIDRIGFSDWPDQILDFPDQILNFPDQILTFPGSDSRKTPDQILKNTGSDSRKTPDRISRFTRSDSNFPGIDSSVFLPKLKKNSKIFDFWSKILTTQQGSDPFFIRFPTFPNFLWYVYCRTTLALSFALYRCLRVA